MAWWQADLQKAKAYRGRKRLRVSHVRQLPDYAVLAHHRALAHFRASRRADLVVEVWLISGPEPGGGLGPDPEPDFYDAWPVSLCVGPFEEWPEPARLDGLPAVLQFVDLPLAPPATAEPEPKPKPKRKTRRGPRPKPEPKRKSKAK